MVLLHVTFAWFPCQRVFSLGCGRRAAFGHLFPAHNIDCSLFFTTPWFSCTFVCWNVSLVLDGASFSAASWFLRWGTAEGIRSGWTVCGVITLGHGFMLL